MMETIHEVMITLTLATSVVAVYYASKSIKKMSGYHIRTFNYMLTGVLLFAFGTFLHFVREIFHTEYLQLYEHMFPLIGIATILAVAFYAKENKEEWGIM